MAKHYFMAKVKVDITRYKSGDELLERWLTEAEAAEGAEEAGVIVSVWKDVSAPLVYGVLCMEADSSFEAHAALLKALMGLPMGQDGALVFEDISEVRPYSEWRQFLRQSQG